MISAFKRETRPLTEDELKLVPGFIEGLRLRKKGNQVTEAHIKNSYAEKGIKLSGARIRKIINHIRIHKLVTNLVASNKGYYVSEDPVEIQRYVQSLYQRAGAIVAVAKSLEV